MTLKEEIRYLKKGYDEQIKNLWAELKEQRALLAPIQLYIAGQQAVKELEKGKDVSISPSVLNIIKWLVLIVGTLVTGRILL